jgi:hypothetical protein
MLRTSERRALAAKKKGEKTYTFFVTWGEYDEPAEEDWDLPDRHVCGWYVAVKCGNDEFDIGPEFDEPGFQTFDAALVFIKKWAEDRGITYHIPPCLSFNLIQENDQ